MGDGNTAAVDVGKLTVVAGGGSVGSATDGVGPGVAVAGTTDVIAAVADDGVSVGGGAVLVGDGVDVAALTVIVTCITASLPLLRATKL